MSYYHTCPLCGAHLDPDEKCDCLEQDITEEEKENKDDEALRNSGNI